MARYTEQDLDDVQAKPRPKGTLPRLPGGRDHDQLCAWLTRALRPPEGFRVDGFERHGRQRADPCTLNLRNGRDTMTYNFTQQSDLIGARLRSTVLAASDGELAVPHLTASEVDDVWAALVTLGKVTVEHDERDETRKWVQQMLDIAHPLRGYTLEPERRHDALMALRNLGEFKRPDALALLRPSEDWSRRPVRFIDEESDEQWVRAGETATFVRWVCGAEPLAFSTLRGRLHQIGVEWRPFEDYRPPHPKINLYQLTDELIEWIEATNPTPASTLATTAQGEMAF
jgi:hypothetical protein